MSSPVCAGCLRPKVVTACGICQGPLCKKCAQVVKKGTFAYLKPLPAELSHKEYCQNCYWEKVEPALLSYNRTLYRAKNFFVFHTHQGEETRLMKRVEKPIQVEDCTDREEALLLLAFQAAHGDFNTLIDVRITQKQKRNEGYQTSRFSGVAVPVKLEASRIAEMEATMRKR